MTLASGLHVSVSSHAQQMLAKRRSSSRKYNPSILRSGTRPTFKEMLALWWAWRKATRHLSQSKMLASGKQSWGWVISIACSFWQRNSVKVFKTQPCYFFFFFGAKWALQCLHWFWINFGRVSHVCAGKLWFLVQDILMWKRYGWKGLWPYIQYIFSFFLKMV